MDGRSRVVDTSNGLVLGMPPGLELFPEAVWLLLPLLDGIVTSPGKERNLGTLPRYLMGMKELLMAIVVEPKVVRGLVEMSVTVNLELAKEVVA